MEAKRDEVNSMMGTFDLNLVPGLLEKFVAAIWFPIAACGLLALIALWAGMWSRSTSDYRALHGFLNQFAKQFQQDRGDAAITDLVNKNYNLKLPADFGTIRSQVIGYRNQFLFHGTSGKFKTTQAASKALNLDVGYDGGLSRAADQIVRMALFFTFLGIAFGLFQATGVVSDAIKKGSDSPEIIKGIGDLLSTATNKFIISAVGLFIAVVLKGWNTRRHQKIDRVKSDIYDEMDKIYLIDKDLGGPELEAAHHIIKGIETGFSSLISEIRELNREFSGVTDQVKVWHEIATKITAEQNYHSLGLDMQVFVKQTVRALEEEFLDQFRKTDLLLEEQRKVVMKFSKSSSNLARSINNLAKNVP